MTNPSIPLLLQVSVTAVSIYAYWPNPSDGSQFANKAWQWTVTFAVNPQHVSDASLGHAYTGLNIVVGDWFSDQVGGRAWIIRSIASGATTSSVTCVLEDVKQYNTYSDPSTGGNGAPANNASGFVFSLDESGQPILAPVPVNVLTSQWQSDLMGRFAAVSPPVTTALLQFAASTAVDSEAQVLTLQNGVLMWVPASALGGTSGTSFFQLEDGSGFLLLEDGSGYLTLES